MKPVTVYTSPTCPYCLRAKSMLADLHVPFTEVDIVANPEKRQEMADKYQWMTVPMIVVGDEFIGGFDDMAALHAKGELMKKINA